MHGVRSSLIRQLQAFFEERLRGVYRWQTAGDVHELPPAGTIRIRAADKHPKVRGQRQLERETVAIDFGNYSLMVSSPDEEPPVGKIVIFDPERGALEGPLDVATWDRVEVFIKEGHDRCQTPTSTTAMRA